MRHHAYLTWLGAIAIGLSALMISPVRAEDTNTAALAVAMKSVPTTLEQGLKASEKSGKPISAKFEINDDGKLQLSIYTVGGDGFTEVVVAPDTGAVTSTEKITGADDLKAANAAHFHGPAAIGANAGIVLPIGGAGVSSRVKGEAKLGAQRVADLLGGKWYANVHTATNPSGEIRGHVLPTE